MEDKYKIVGYSLNVPVLKQVGLTHRDKELVRKIDSLRRVPREELAKVFGVAVDDIYKAINPRQPFLPRLPKITAEIKKKAADLVLEGHPDTQIANMVGISMSTVARIRRSLRDDAKDT